MHHGQVRHRVGLVHLSLRTQAALVEPLALESPTLVGPRCSPANIGENANSGKLKELICPQFGIFSQQLQVPADGNVDTLGRDPEGSAWGLT